LQKENTMGSMQPYFNFYQFPTGRRLFAMRGVLRIARERGQDGIAALAEKAVAQAQHAADLDAGWRRSRKTRVGVRAEAGAIDNAIDRTLSGIAAHLGALAHAFGDEPAGRQAAALTARLFPEGVSAITHLAFEDELAACEAILRDLNGSHAADAGALGLGPFIERLEGLLLQFRTALKSEQGREVTHDQIRAAQAEGQDAMLRVVAKVLGDFHGASGEHVELRSALLAPVVSQNGRLRERFSRHRGVVDVNPETGEELAEEEEDLPPPSAGMPPPASADLEAGPAAP
jgi:hypothetical protein